MRIVCLQRARLADTSPGRVPRHREDAAAGPVYLVGFLRKARCQV